jgi:hypothetical protein
MMEASLSDKHQNQPTNQYNAQSDIQSSRATHPFQSFQLNA